MENKSRMQRWQIITLIIALIVTIALIIVVNAPWNKESETLAAQDSPQSTVVEVTDTTSITDASPVETANTTAEPTPSDNSAAAAPAETSTTNSDATSTNTSADTVIAVPSPTSSAKPAVSPSASASTSASNSAAATGTKKGNSSSTSNSSSATPKNGATKVENGTDYIYVEGFGWIVNEHGKSSNSTAEMETSGEHVGSMG